MLECIFHTVSHAKWIHGLVGSRAKHAVTSNSFQLSGVFVVSHSDTEASSDAAHEYLYTLRFLIMEIFFISACEIE